MAPTIKFFSLSGFQLQQKGQSEFSWELTLLLWLSGGDVGYPVLFTVKKACAHADPALL